jgi:hypothetical protein
LKTFSKISGLTINLQKSELIITSSTPQQIEEFAALLQCKAASFPFTYLGLSLSDKKLPKVAYQPMLHSIQKAPLLSPGGRQTLVNSVITAIPVYYMSVLSLPKRVITEIDKIRRRFLWHGHKEHEAQKRPMYLTNWKLVTRSKDMGGLGIRDLQDMNISLLMKWMWQWIDNANKWWQEITATQQQHIRPWQHHNALVFWKDIAKLAPIFDSSVRFALGRGTKKLVFGMIPGCSSH